MLTDIEQLKNDFLVYLNFLIFPSPESLIEKIKPLQGTQLRKIKFQSDSERKLSIKNRDKNIPVITLYQNELEIYGLSISDFETSIKAIKNNDKNKKKLLSQAIKEIIDFRNEKLCKIYVPLAILTYTELYEKFKLAHSKEKDSHKIHTLILESCIDTFSQINSDFNRLTFNLITFISAYEYQNFDFNEISSIILSDQDDRTYEYIFNTTKKIQLTPYKETFINLLHSIEELDNLPANDIAAINDLTKKLKDLTKNCFKDLIQATFYEKNEKYTSEKEATKKLYNCCDELITEYRREHPDEFKNKWGPFQRILQLIVNLIPTAFLSRSKRMSFFFNKEENYNKITSEITLQLNQLASLNFFSRISFEH